jgi:hypothetical protein
VVISVRVQTIPYPMQGQHRFYHFFSLPRVIGPTFDDLIHFHVNFLKTINQLNYILIKFFPQRNGRQNFVIWWKMIYGSDFTVINIMFHRKKLGRAGIAQSVQWLTTDWKTEESGSESRRWTRIILFQASRPTLVKSHWTSPCGGEANTSTVALRVVEGDEKATHCLGV